MFSLNEGGFNILRGAAPKTTHSKLDIISIIDLRSQSLKSILDLVPAAYGMGAPSARLLFHNII